MKRNLIDRTELFNRLATITAADPNEMKAKIYAVIQDMDGEPGAVDILRCKECKWFDADENESDSWHLCTRHFGMYINFAEDDYCSYGERKER